MDLRLSEKTESLIQKHLASGKYDSPQQIVEEALEQFDQQAAALAEVNAKLEVGLADLRAGRFREIRTEEDVASLKKDVFQRIKERHELGG
ncbi:ribbon-helix-helix domain-containing protein [Blastopirellula marina]|nr:hypothetical protein [Blastopirellula marina]